MRFGLPTLGVSGRFKINHSEPAFATLTKLGAAYSSGLYTEVEQFFVLDRLCDFWWRRRRDVVSQFLGRIIVGVTSDPVTIAQAIRVSLGDSIDRARVPSRFLNC